jgi:hypothetical protein
MADAERVDALTTLVYALDEMRETTSLLPVADLSRSTNRPWWRKVFFAFARSKAEVTAGFAVQYLDENLQRARAHWREALSLLGQLQQAHDDNEVVVILGHELQHAGLDGVLPRLQHSAIPTPIARTAAHLIGVVETIRDCDRVALAARNKLALQRMRDQ